MVGAIESYFAEHPQSSVKEVRVVLIDTRTIEAFQTEFASRYGGN